MKTDLQTDNLSKTLEHLACYLGEGRPDITDAILKISDKLIADEEDHPEVVPALIKIISTEMGQKKTNEATDLFWAYTEAKPVFPDRAFIFLSVLSNMDVPIKMREMVRVKLQEALSPSQDPEECDNDDDSFLVFLEEVRKKGLHIPTQALRNQVLDKCARLNNKKGLTFFSANKLLIFATYCDSFYRGAASEIGKRAASLLNKLPFDKYMHTYLDIASIHSPTSLLGSSALKLFHNGLDALPPEDSLKVLKECVEKRTALFQSKDVENTPHDKELLIHLEGVWLDKIAALTYGSERSFIDVGENIGVTDRLALAALASSVLDLGGSGNGDMYFDTAMEHLKNASRFYHVCDMGRHERIIDGRIRWMETAEKRHTFRQALRPYKKTDSKPETDIPSVAEVAQLLCTLEPKTPWRKADLSAFSGNEGNVMTFPPPR